MDQYALTVLQALHSQNRHSKQSTFEIFYRKPCSPEIDFLIFGGTSFVVQHIREFRLSSADIAFIKERILPTASDELLDYLRSLDHNRLKLTGLPEGTAVYPHMPILTITGEIGHILLIEAAVLAIFNVCSSAATVGFIYSLNAGGRPVVEFGLRRAHGTQSGYLCSLYSSLSGLAGTSNVVANRVNNIRTFGTMSHAYITAFDADMLEGLLKSQKPIDKFGMTEGEFFAEIVLLRQRFGFLDTNTAELIAFSNFAITFSKPFSVLVDTFNVLKSGIPNFLICAHFLAQRGFGEFSVRLDSGDLIELSIRAKEAFESHDKAHQTAIAANTKIMGTNDINLEFLREVARRPNKLDIFGIGTNLSNFRDIRPIGFVFKLVEAEGVPKFKVTENGLEKASLPWHKTVWLTSANGRSGYMVTRGSDSLAAGSTEQYLLQPGNKKAELAEFRVETAKQLTRDFPFDYRLDTEDFRSRAAEALKKGLAGEKLFDYVTFSKAIVDPVLETIKQRIDG